MKQTLIETFTFKPISSITEDVGGKKYLFVEGRVQYADKPNANKRIYPRPVLDQAINNESIKESLANNRLLGALDHPTDGKTTLENASHLLKSFNLKEDGELTARIQILSTPKGQILRALCEDGVEFGGSSRGTGSLKPSADGKYQMVQPDFKFETIDMVYNPSTLGAYPKPIFESTDTEYIKENLMNASERFADLEARAYKALRVRSKGLDKSASSLVESNLTSFMIEASKLSSEAPEVSKLSENLINDLAKKRTELREETVGDTLSGFHRFVPGLPAPAPGEGGHIVDPGAVAVPSDVEQMITTVADALRANSQGLIPAPGEGGHIVDPGAVAVPSPAEQMITALVHEAEEAEDEDEEEKKKKKKEKVEESEEDKDEDEEEKKKKKKEDEMKESFNSFATGVLKNKKASKGARGLAAGYLTEASRRKNEINAFKKIITKMQEKFDAAVKDGKIVVENTDEQLTFKYKLATDVLKEVVRRYHVNEAYHYAKSRLAETGLDKDDKAVAVVSESLKTSGTKAAIEEAIVGFAKISGTDLSKVERPKSVLPVPVTESTEKPKAPVSAAKPNELPLKIEGKIAKLNESTEKPAPAESYTVSLANRLNKSLAGSRSK